jgi:hypothetical protein
LESFLGCTEHEDHDWLYEAACAWTRVGSIPDLGQSAGASFKGEEKMARGKRRKDPGLLLAHLLAGTEPGSTAERDPKRRVTKAAPARNKIALTRTAIGALRSIQKQPKRVQNYFGQKDVAYAA